MFKDLGVRSAGLCLFEVRYRLPDSATVYEITLRNATGKAEAVVGATEDGAVLPVESGIALIGLQRDGAVHRVEVQLG